MNLIAFVFFGLLYVFLGFVRKFADKVRVLPIYLFARLKYYEVLSQIVWDHMGITMSPRVAALLEERAVRRLVARKRGTKAEPLGVQRAVRTYFEARLLASYVRNVKAGDFQKVFELESYHKHQTIEGFEEQPLKTLLRIAYYKQIRKLQNDSREVEEEKKGFDDKIGDLFGKYRLP